jgi:hypothetical protein|uniref:Uncharacterized protein n=1 Tax=Desulfobacca acetoxidans TaxID=60893 RepID=A0A7C3WG93_9BACT
MENRAPVPNLEAELARTRKLLAAGRHQEALLLVLKLLQQTLGNLRHRLITLNHELAREKEKMSAMSDENQTDYPALFKTGGRYYH